MNLNEIRLLSDQHSIKQVANKGGDNILKTINYIHNNWANMTEVFL